MKHGALVNQSLRTRVATDTGPRRGLTAPTLGSLGTGSANFQTNTERADVRIHEGHRVIGLQRCLQSLGDELLGYTTIADRPYYVRQMRDLKASMPVELLTGNYETNPRANRACPLPLPARSTVERLFPNTPVNQKP